MTAPAPTPDELLALTLQEADQLWELVWLCPTCLDCPNRPIVSAPCKLLARQCGGHTLIRDVLRRLKCRHCGGRRLRVEATDDVAAGSHGGKPGWWRITLRE